MGTPKAEIQLPMPKADKVDHTLTPGKVKSYVEEEGVAYACHGYFDVDRIPDPELRKLCQGVRDSVKALEKYLEPVEATW